MPIHLSLTRDRHTLFFLVPREPCPYPHSSPGLKPRRYCQTPIEFQETWKWKNPSKQMLLCLLSLPKWLSQDHNTNMGPPDYREHLVKLYGQHSLGIAWASWYTDPTGIHQSVFHIKPSTSSFPKLCSTLVFVMKFRADTATGSFYIKANSMVWMPIKNPVLFLVKVRHCKGVRCETEMISVIKVCSILCIPVL